MADSGSRDGSARARARRTARRVIAVERFSHGGTRNLLMERARGAHVAFLTQDAVPADEHWLARLLAGFELADDVGARLRPLPAARRRAGRRCARELDGWFALAGARRRGRAWTGTDATPRGPGAATFFTDANGCVARRAWERVPFREVPYAEDQALALRHAARRLREGLRAGRRGRPLARVRAVAQFRRSFDEWRGLREVHGWVEPARPVRDAADDPEPRARRRAQPARQRAAARRSCARARARCATGPSAPPARPPARAPTGSRAPCAARLSLEGRDTFEPVD